MNNVKSQEIIEGPTISMPIKIHWLTHLLGCWHRRMGTPFTRGTETYCVCRECGACRKFDTKKWKSVGSYYYYPILSLYDDLQIIK